MAKILLTGSGGFIGGHLKNLLLEKAAPLGITKVVGVSRGARETHEDLVLDRQGWDRFFQEVGGDLSLEAPTRLLLRTYQPDVIFHLAGDPRVKDEPLDPSRHVRSHVLSTQHLLAHCPKGCRFVYASSCTVYGDRNWVGGCCEDDPVRPTSSYGAAKAAAELLVNTASRAGRVNGLVVRLAATVGKGATHGLVPDLVKKLFSLSLTLDLFGNEPGSVKPYTHVSDVVSGLIQLGFAAKEVGGFVNLANEDSVSVLDAAVEVMRELGRAKPVRWLGEQPDWADNPKLFVSSERARGFGWKPGRSLEAVARAAREIGGAA
jgi:UDP-glucose 4-epimerase